MKTSLTINLVLFFTCYGLLVLLNMEQNESKRLSNCCMEYSKNLQKIKEGLDKNYRYY